MKRTASLFGAGLTVFFVMFSAGPTVDQARAADAPPAVRAADAPATPGQKAKQHYVQGEAYFKSKNFSDAIDEYQKGYLEKPDPVFIFNIAQCQRLLGHTSAAVEFYQRYLKEAPEGPGRPVAEKQIAELTAPPAGVEPPAATDGAAVPVPVAPAPVASVAPVVPLPPAAPPTPPATAVTTPPAAAPTTAETVPAEPAPAPVLTAVPPPFTAAPGAPVFVSARAQPTEPPVYKRWYFWTAIAALAVSTIIVAAATSPDRPGCDAGRICK